MADLLDFSNPNTMGYIGLLSGLGQAAMPSRLPVPTGAVMGMAASGLAQGQQQGLQNAMLWQRLKMMQNDPILNGSAFGAPQAGGAQPTQQGGQPAIAPTQGGAMGSGTFGIPTGGQPAASPAAGVGGGAPVAAGGLFGGRMTPMDMFRLGYSHAMVGLPDGSELMKLAAQYDPSVPTEATKLAAQSGTDPRAANAALLRKNTYIPPTQIRGFGIATPEGLQPLPMNAPQGSMPYQDPVTKQWSFVPVEGGAAMLHAAAEAQGGGKAAGEGTALPEKIWDPAANDGQGGYVFRTRTQVAQAAGGAAPAASAPTGAPAPMRNNNPGALMPGGKLAQFDTPEAGLQAMDANLAGYGKKGINTLQGVISTWAPQSGGNDTAAYIKDVSARLGIAPNAPVDLSNPVQRHAIATAIMLHENGPAAVFAAPKGAGGPLLAEPPLGKAQSQGASQTAPSDQMKNDYGTMATAGPQAQQSLEYLDHMLQLANKKPFYMGLGVGGAPGIERVSTDAAEYEKARASYISAQGKALGAGGTDAARATIDQAVPEYGKPQDAMISGLTDQRNQLVTSILRRQVLTPVYQSGNEKSYTELANGFDQNLKPSMAPVLSLSGEARRAAVKAAIQRDPSLRPNYEWAFNHGLMQ